MKTIKEQVIEVECNKISILEDFAEENFTAKKILKKRTIEYRIESNLIDDEFDITEYTFYLGFARGNRYYLGELLNINIDEIRERIENEKDLFNDEVLREISDYRVGMCNFLDDFSDELKELKKDEDWEDKRNTQFMYEGKYKGTDYRVLHILHERERYPLRFHYKINFKNYSKEFDVRELPNFMDDYNQMKNEFKYYNDVLDNDEKMKKFIEEAIKKEYIILDI